MFGSLSALRLAACGLAVAGGLAAPIDSLPVGQAVLTTDAEGSWVCGQTGHVRWAPDARVPNEAKVGLYLAREGSPAHLLHARAFDYSDHGAALTLDCSGFEVPNGGQPARLAVALGRLDDGRATVLAMSPPFVVSRIAVVSPDAESVLLPGVPFNVTWVSEKAGKAVDVHLYGRGDDGSSQLIQTVSRAVPDEGSARLTVPGNVTKEFPAIFVRVSVDGNAVDSPDYTVVPTALDADAAVERRRRQLINPNLPIGGTLHAAAEVSRGLFSFAFNGVTTLLTAARQAGAGIGVGIGSVRSGDLFAVQKLMEGKPVAAANSVVSGLMNGVGTAALGIAGALTTIASCVGTSVTTGLGVMGTASQMIANGVTFGGRI